MTMDLNLDNVTKIAAKYGALQHPAEALSLLTYLQKNPPATILEVGVWRGGNSALFGTFLPGVRLIGVDVLGPDNPDEDFVGVCHDIGSHPQLSAVCEEFDLEMVVGSAEAESSRNAVLELLSGRRADFLFIDAAHDYDSAKRNFEFWSPLAFGVGFHDLHNPDVFRFWLELTGLQGIKATGMNPRTCAVWKELDGHGIGVIA